MVEGGGPVLGTGRCGGASAAPGKAPATASMRAASAASVGDPNSSRSGRSTLATPRTRDITCVASSVWAG